MISTVNSLELLETPKNIASGRSQSIQSKSNCSAVLPSYIETTAESANHMWGSCENEPPNHNAHHTDVSDWGFPISKNDTSIVVSSNNSCRSNNGSLHPLERATRSTAAAAAALLIRSTTAPPASVTVTHVSSDALSDSAGAPTVTEVPTVSTATTESVILTATFAAKSFGLSAPTTMGLLEPFARITENSASIKPSKSLVIESVFAESLLKTINSLDGIVKFVTESTKPAAAATEFPKSPAAATCTVESSVSTESSWSSMLASESVEPLSTAIDSFSSAAANDSVASSVAAKIQPISSAATVDCTCTESLVTATKTNSATMSASVLFPVELSVDSRDTVLPRETKSCKPLMDGGCKLYKTPSATEAWMEGRHLPIGAGDRLLLLPQERSANNSTIRSQTVDTISSLTTALREVHSLPIDLTGLKRPLTSVLWRSRSVS